MFAFYLYTNVAKKKLFCKEFEFMNLIIDDGNTFVKLYIVENNTVLARKKFRYVDNKQAADIIRDFLLPFNIEQAGLVSVGGKQALLSEILNNYDFQLHIIDWRSDIPVKNLYSTPQTLGMDRLAAAVGANYLYPNENLLIIDIGSAITYDIVTENNEYLGGNISPGVEFRFRALNDYTSSLPYIEPSKIENKVGRSTKEAINNGVILGVLYELQGYIIDFQENYDKLRTILTGGGAKFFEKKIKNSIFVQLDLVPIGLNHILTHKRNFN